MEKIQGHWYNTDVTLWYAKECNGEMRLKITIAAAKCSVCEQWAEHVDNYLTSMNYNFCPHCGAKMGNEVDRNDKA